MPALQIKSAHALFTANGGTDGYITVADATPFWTTARVWVGSTAVDPFECVITEVVGNFIGLRALPLKPHGGTGYQRTDMSTLLLADSATIDQPTQIVPAELTNLRKL